MLGEFCLDLVQSLVVSSQKNCVVYIEDDDASLPYQEAGIQLSGFETHRLG